MALTREEYMKIRTVVRIKIQQEKGLAPVRPARLSNQVSLGSYLGTTKSNFVVPNKCPRLCKWKGSDNLRTSHVGFMHGGTAAPTSEVRLRFDRWCENVFIFLFYQ